MVRGLGRQIPAHFDVHNFNQINIGLLCELL